MLLSYTDKVSRSLNFFFSSKFEGFKMSNVPSQAPWILKKEFLKSNEIFEKI